MRMGMHGEKWRDTDSLVRVIRKMPKVQRDLLHQLLISDKFRKAVLVGNRYLSIKEHRRKVDKNEY